MEPCSIGLLIQGCCNMPKARLCHTSPTFGRAGDPARLLQQFFMCFPLYYCSLMAWGRMLFDAWQSSLALVQCNPKDTCNLPNRATESTPGGPCSQTERAAVQKCSPHPYLGTSHLPWCRTHRVLHLPCTTSALGTPTKRKITHPTRRRKPCHKQSDSVGNENKQVAYSIVTFCI